MIPFVENVPFSLQATFLADEDLDDLAAFTGMTREDCRRRVESYTLGEHAQAWQQRDPRTAAELLDFYRTSDFYIWELMQWHASHDRLPYWHALEDFVQRFPVDRGFRRVFDFGCGIGSDALFLAARGYDVTLVDVEGPAFRLARHRFERRGLCGRFVESRSAMPEPDQTYDAVICFDVLEHLPDPLAAAARLVDALRPGGVLLQSAAFGSRDDHPCHLAEGCERFGGMRWIIHLLGLGLRGETAFLYRKTSGLERLLQRARFEVWRRTGLWLVRVDRSAVS